MNAVDETERRQREGRTDDAEALMEWCIEREAAEHGFADAVVLPPACRYRWQGCHADERDVLDRSAETCEQTPVSLPTCASAAIALANPKDTRPQHCARRDWPPEPLQALCR